MTSQQSTTLCQVCAEIDFPEYFRRAINNRVDERGLVGANPNACRLGFLEDIYQKISDCPFCWLVVNAICRKHIQSHTSLEALLTQVQTAGSAAVECWMYSYLYADNAAFKTDSKKAYRIGIATRVSEEQFCSADDHSADVQLLAEDAELVCGSKLFYGRKFDPEKFDIDLLRYWLWCCEEKHGRHCEAPGFMYDSLPIVQPRDLLAVNVKNQCLEYLPPKSRYVALSYCWPVGDTFKLTQACLDGLLEAESLKNKMHELPQTIQDAIHCVFELGETYLWVDALCIIQDSETHKRLHLSQMDRIYGSALLTIVSAGVFQDATSGSVGLPRYRENPRGARQKVALVRGLRLLTCYESIEQIIQQSRWGGRAWTFQESLLSRRLCYFTDIQVYFQCSCSVFCEDGVGEAQMLFAYITSASNLWNMGRPYSSDSAQTYYGTRHLRRWPYQDRLEAIREYREYVGNYRSRKMSFSSDILNAFQGLQNIMQHSMSTEFWYGLPEKYFDTALLWVLKGPHTRIGISPFDHTPTNPRFPSWSWVGWDSEVTMDSYFYITGLRHEVYWLVISRNGQAISIEPEAPTQESEFPASGNKDVSPGNLPHDDPPLRVQPRHEVDTNSEDWRFPEFLACWTTLAVFYISGKIAPVGTAIQRLPNQINLVISDDSDNWVGSIVMDPRWAADHLLPIQSFEFMLLSRSEDSKQYHLVPQPKFFDENFLLKRKWCMLNVMLIEREGNIARRLGVGIIHEDAWLVAEPRTMFIKLE